MRPIKSVVLEAQRKLNNVVEMELDKQISFLTYIR